MKNKFHESFCKMFHVKHFPPGMDMETEKLFFGLGMCGAFFYSWTFVWRYLQARAELYLYSDGKYILVEQRVMADFSELLGNALIGFWLVAIGLVGFAVLHYLHFWQGSKSIYLMKRLPDKMELHKRALTLPILALLICVVTAFLLLVSYYGLYRVATPKQCIPVNQWIF